LIGLTDKLVKSRKGPFFIISACLCGARRQAPESSMFKALQETWTPFFNGVTTFCRENTPPHPCPLLPLGGEGTIFMGEGDQESVMTVYETIN
jgi:hypothetical protein